MVIRWKWAIHSSNSRFGTLMVLSTWSFFWNLFFVWYVAQTKNIGGEIRKASVFIGFRNFEHPIDKEDERGSQTFRLHNSDFKDNAVSFPVYYIIIAFAPAFGIAIVALFNWKAVQYHGDGYPEGSKWELWQCWGWGFIYFFYCLVVYTPTSMGIILCFVTSSMFREKFKALERITLPLNEVRYRLTALKAKMDKFIKKINTYFLYQAVLNWASFTMLWIWQLVYVSTQKEYSYRTDFFAGWAAVYSFGFVVLLLPPALLTSRAELFVYRLKTKYCLNSAG